MEEDNLVYGIEEAVREGAFPEPERDGHFYVRHSQQYVEEAFGGSLPAFLAAFGTRKKLSEQEIEEIQGIIDSMRG